MRAMVLERPGEKLRPDDRPIPEPGAGQVRVRVLACGICRTDLHVVDGELTEPRLPLIPGHQIVGEVTALGEDVDPELLHRTVGIPWLGWTCGQCRFCRNDQENLCETARFTGYTLDGGFAEHTVADARYCFPIPETYPALQAAPLLCAGLIGYRSLRMAGDAPRLGLYGFGAAAHIVAQVARYQQREIYAFTRPGDQEAQRFARELGATWAGSSEQRPPEPLGAAIIFAPVGPLVPLALEALDPGGTLVLGGIHMSEIPAMPYSLLWQERQVRSVANLTRRDGTEFLRLAPELPVETQVVTYPLAQANEALSDLRHGRFTGAAVLVVDDRVRTGPKGQRA
jgi:propanol-preferring alcohol dehydrogenase